MCWLCAARVQRLICFFLRIQRKIYHGGLAKWIQCNHINPECVVFLIIFALYVTLPLLRTSKSLPCYILIEDNNCMLGVVQHVILCKHLLLRVGKGLECQLHSWPLLPTCILLAFIWLTLHAYSLDLSEIWVSQGHLDWTISKVPASELVNWTCCYGVGVSILTILYQQNIRYHPHTIQSLLVICTEISCYKMALRLTELA